MLLKRIHHDPRAAEPRYIKFLANRQKFYQGFTLIELTVVIFIVGLLFFTALPKIGNFFFQTDIKRVVRSLKAAVYLLRSKSITTGKNTVLHVDLGKNVYWGTYENTEQDPPLYRDTPFIVSPQNLPKGTKFLDAYNINSDQKTSLSLSSAFNSKGVFEETVLHLADQQNRVFTLIINAYTGRFLIYDEYVDVEYGKRY